MAPLDGENNTKVYDKGVPGDFIGFLILIKVFIGFLSYEHAIKSLVV